MKRTLATAALALVFCSCHTPPGPSVSLVNVRFTQATVLETSGVFTLRLNNETPDPLQLRGGVHKIYLNGLYLGEGLNNEPLEVAGLSSATQSVTVHLSNLALVTRLKPLIESKVFDYRVESVLYPTTGRLHTSSEGRLDLREFQPTPSSR